MVDDGFIVDFHHPNVGNVLHICSDKKSADEFMKNMYDGDASFAVFPCVITLKP